MSILCTYQNFFKVDENVAISKSGHTITLIFLCLQLKKDLSFKCSLSVYAKIEMSSLFFLLFSNRRVNSYSYILLYKVE